MKLKTNVIASYLEWKLRNLNYNNFDIKNALEESVNIDNIKKIPIVKESSLPILNNVSTINSVANKDFQGLYKGNKLKNTLKLIKSKELQTLNKVNTIKKENNFLNKPIVSAEK